MRMDEFVKNDFVRQETPVSTLPLLETRATLHVRPGVKIQYPCIKPTTTRNRPACSPVRITLAPNRRLGQDPLSRQLDRPKQRHPRI